MKKALHALATYCILALSSSAHAAYWTDYQLKLKKATTQPDPSVTIYQLRVETAQGAAVTPTQNMKASLDRIAGAFVATVTEQPYALNASYRGDQELALSFLFAVSKEQAYFSCFQHWYTGLSNESKFLLKANLHETDAQLAQAELATYTSSLEHTIGTEFTTCATKYDNFVLDDLDADYLYTGIRRWLAGLELRAGYRNFRYLLDPTRTTFDQRHRQPSPELELRNALLKRWLKVVSQRAAPDDVFETLPTVMADTSAQLPEDFAFLGLKHWAAIEDLRAVGCSTGEVSEGLRAVLHITDELMLACFEITASRTDYHCGSEQQAQDRLARLIYSPSTSWRLSPFSFIARK
jgi:hypothetical protein